MSEEAQYTFQDIAEHNTKDDLFLAIDGVVYDVSKFSDEHPISGGEEVLLDCAGQDASEAFEDVGHSDEAREILAKLKVGTVKFQPGEGRASKAANKAAATSGSSQKYVAGDIISYVGAVVIGAAAYFGYQYFQKQQELAAAVGGAPSSEL